MPKSPALRGKRLKELYLEDEVIQKNLTFYDCLRTILKSSYEKRQEFRRHVTLIINCENSTIEVEIDNLTNCEKFIHKFLFYSLGKIEGIKEEENY